jgi:hypothetical protein
MMISTQMMLMLIPLQQSDDRCLCDVLARLLKLVGCNPPSHESQFSCETCWRGVTCGNLYWPNGLCGRAMYKGKSLEFSIANDRVRILDRDFGSMNKAARFAVQSLGGDWYCSALKLFRVEFPKGSNTWRTLESFRAPDRKRLRGVQLRRVSRDAGLTWRYEWC